MPRGGHNAKPIPIRKLEGNPGKREINPHAPEMEPLEDLTPPSVLDTYGKQCWQRNAPVLARLGILTAADADLLTVYCDAYSQWRRASIAVRKVNPADEDYRRVAVSVEKARDQMRLLAGELGLSQSSRARMAVAAPKQDTDPMEDMLSGRRSG